MSKVKLKPCSVCGVMPVFELWASGRTICAIRCNNPDRPDSCDIPFYYSRSSSFEEAIIKWNAYQSGGEIYEKVNEAWNTRYTENLSRTSENAPNSGENNSSE